MDATVLDSSMTDEQALEYVGHLEALVQTQILAFTYPKLASKYFKIIAKLWVDYEQGPTGDGKGDLQAFRYESGRRGCTWVLLQLLVNSPSPSLLLQFMRSHFSTDPVILNREAQAWTDLNLGTPHLSVIDHIAPKALYIAQYIIQSTRFAALGPRRQRQARHLLKLVTCWTNDIRIVSWAFFQLCGIIDIPSIFGDECTDHNRQKILLAAKVALYAKLKILVLEAAMNEKFVKQQLAKTASVDWEGTIISIKQRWGSWSSIRGPRNARDPSIYKLWKAHKEACNKLSIRTFPILKLARLPGVIPPLGVMDLDKSCWPLTNREPVVAGEMKDAY